MSFSDRLGITKAKAALQIDGIDNDLKNGLWQACLENFFTYEEGNYEYDQPFRAVMGEIFVNFYKLTTDLMPYGYQSSIGYVRDQFFKAKWWEVYNFLEFLLAEFDVPPFTSYDGAFSKRVSWFLEREKSGFRVLQGKLTPITDSIELSAISQAADLGSRYAGARQHIRSAIELFSKKPQPDYRNSIKEAISAVESTAQVVTGSPKATLGEALKSLDSKIAIHPAMCDGMSKIYGYTSDQGGIRHALLEESNIDEAEAKFMLVACSAFVNFCVQRST